MTIINYDNFLAYKRESAILKKMIFEANRNKWEEFCEEISPRTSMTEIWKNLNYITKAASKNNHKSIAFKNSLELAREFLISNYPSRTDMTPTKYNFTTNLTKTSFTIENQDESISKKKHSAPEVDKIDYQMLKGLEIKNKIELVKLINNTWRNGDFPIELGEVKIVPIAKKA